MTDSNSGLQHRLAVVWFTDLVGWSSLASKDEDRAIALVRRFQAGYLAGVGNTTGLSFPSADTDATPKK